MPTTRYGVRVGLSTSKRYSVLTSAAPILSNQKRYGVQVENRVIITKKYPVTLLAYSLRYAYSEQETRARRKEREIPTSLLQRDVATDESLNEQHVFLEHLVRSNAEGMHADVVCNDLETGQEASYLSETFIHKDFKANPKQINENEAQIDALSAVQKKHEQDVLIQGNIQAERFLGISEAVDLSLETSNKNEVQTVHSAETEIASSAGNEHNVISLNMEPTVRDKIIRLADESILSKSVYVSEMHTSELSATETARIERPIQVGSLSEMDASDSPYKDTFEHRIYSASYIKEIHDTHELRPWILERVQMDHAMIDHFDSIQEYGRITDVSLDQINAVPEFNRSTDAFYDESFDATRKGHTFEAINAAVSITNPLETVHYAGISMMSLASFEQIESSTVLLEQKRAHSDRRQTAAMITLPEQADRFTRVMHAFKVEHDHVNNNGQIINSILAENDHSTIIPSLQDMWLTDMISANKGVANVRPAIRSKGTVSIRNSREWSAYASGITQANDNVIAQDIMIQSLERADNIAGEWLHMLEDTLERTVGNRAVVPAEIRTLEKGDHRVKEVLSAEVLPLLQGKTFEKSFDALLETMDAGEKDGRLVEEARTEAAGRIRADRPSELTDALRGSLIGNIESVVHDEHEKGLLVEAILNVTLDDSELGMLKSADKDGLFDDTERAARSNSDRYVQLNDLVQGNQKTVIDVAVISSLELGNYYERAVEAEESRVLKAHASDSWLASVMNESTQAKALETQGEATTAILEPVRRMMETEFAEPVHLEQAIRETNVISQIENINSAGKVTDYNTYMVTHESALANHIPDDAWMSKTLPALHETSRSGIETMEAIFDAVTTKQEEFEVADTRLDGALGAARDVEEQRIDSSVRKQAERTALLTDPDRGETSFRDNEAMLSLPAAMNRTSGVQAAIQDEYEPSRRADGETNAIRNDVQTSLYAGNEQIAYIESFENGLRWSEQTAQEVDTFAHAERLHVELTYRSDQLDQAERMSENDAIHFLMPTAERVSENDSILSGIIEQADQMDQILASLEKIESGDRIAVNETFMTLFDASDRRYLEEVMFEAWDRAQTVTKPARLDVGTTAERISVNYTELADYDLGAKTMKFGVLVDAETADHRSVEAANLEEYAPSELIVKKKKKIWLIPAHGNHWNNWSGWKKTR